MTHREAEMRAQALGRLVAEEATTQAPAGWIESGAESLMVARPLARARRLPRLPLLAAAAMLLVAGIIVGVRLQRGEPLQYEVAGAQNSSGSRVESGATHPSRITFSDGSLVELAEGASARVRETTVAGATLALERGEARVHVVHRDAARWSLIAGPYELLIVGTKFVVHWDPDTQRFSAELEDGAVRIVGPGISGRVEVLAGQRFDATARDTAWRVTSRAQPDAAAPAQPVPSVDSESQAAAPADDASKTPSAAPPAARDWPGAVRRGAFADVVAEARAGGIERCLAACSTSDLRALADAARYSGELSLAKQALLRLQQRSSADKTRALYLLGSLEEARGDQSAALRWYTKYVATAPSGPLAAEARAGRMRMLFHTSGREAARPAAEEYLRLHPHGVGAATAKRILDEK